jgi:hypothetical protein
VEPPLWAPRRVNRPPKHSDGRLVVYERVVAFGLLLFVFGCEGTWLDCFLRAGDDECVPRVHKTTTSVDITTATEPSSHRRGTASYCEWILVRN